MTDLLPDSLRDRAFRNQSLRGSRFIGCDLGDVVVRGGEVAGMEIESPWLLEGDGRLLVNGVNVVPLVDTELNRRFPGRELRDARDPEGLSAAWAEGAHLLCPPTGTRDRRAGGALRPGEAQPG